ncbi:hypothetical protein Avbf_16697 [Armadillidium vulgare]|nr:hypothetical protein Avbf_16697 [Armadillidium vulgare]
MLCSFRDDRKDSSSSSKQNPQYSYLNNRGSPLLLQEHLKGQINYVLRILFIKNRTILVGLFFTLLQSISSFKEWRRISEAFLRKKNEATSSSHSFWFRF